MTNKYNRDFYTLTTLLMGLIALQVLVKGKVFSADRPRILLKHVEVPVTDSSYQELRSKKTTSSTKSNSFRLRASPTIDLSSLSGQPDVANTRK
jgi:hypothetical protein